MEPRSRSKRAGWLQRGARKLGSVFGAIAKRLAGPSIPISAVILARSASVNAVRPEQPLEDVVQIFVTGCTQVPVIDHGMALGVVTRAAIGDSIASAGPHAPVGDVALRDVVVVGPSAELDHVLAALDGHPGAIALVVDRGEPVGLVTREQLDAYLAAQAV